jgi:hypothetical protein
VINTAAVGFTQLELPIHGVRYYHLPAQFNITANLSCPKSGFSNNNLINNNKK